MGNPNKADDTKAEVQSPIVRQSTHGKSVSNSLSKGCLSSISAAAVKCQKLEWRIVSLEHATQIVETALVSLNAIDGVLHDARTLLEKCGPGASKAELRALNVVYNEFCNQISLFTAEASFDGENLLAGHTITVSLDESGDTAIELVGEKISSRTLGLIEDGDAGSGKIKYHKALERIDLARPFLRSQIALFEARYNVLRSRVEFMEKLHKSFEQRARKLYALNSDSAALNALVRTLTQENDESTPDPDEDESMIEVSSNLQDLFKKNNDDPEQDVAPQSEYPEQLDSVDFVDETPPTDMMSEGLEIQPGEVRDDNTDLIQSIEEAFSEMPELSKAGEGGLQQPPTNPSADNSQECQQLESISISSLLKKLDDSAETGHAREMPENIDATPDNDLPASSELDRSLAKRIIENAERFEDHSQITVDFDEDVTIEEGLHDTTENEISEPSKYSDREQQSDHSQSGFGFNIVRNIFSRASEGKYEPGEANAEDGVQDIPEIGSIEFTISALDAHCSYVTKYLLPDSYALLLESYKAGDKLVFMRSICELDPEHVNRELGEAWLTNADIRKSIRNYNREFSELIRLSIKADPDARREILEYWAKSEYGEAYSLFYSATPQPMTA